MCVGVFSVGFGPGLDSMSPARSRRSASHAAGTHGRLPQKTGRPGLRRGGVGGYNLHSVPPNSPPDCGTVAHQPRAGCIRLDNMSTTLPMTTPPKILGLTLDPKLTYNRHIDLAVTKARKTINILSPLPSGANHTRHIQSHNQTRTRVCFYHMVTQCIRNKLRQTTDSTKHCS